MERHVHSKRKRHIREPLALLFILALTLCSILSNPTSARAAHAGFPDVDPGAWYVSELDYAIENGLMSGYADGRFAPSDKITRGQLAVMLWRVAGEPKRDAANFSDVDYTAFYGGAIEWARYTGVISGYANGTFGPNDPVTREQVATMIANYADRVAALRTGSDGRKLDHLADADSVSSFARSPMGWAVDNGLISGDLSSGVARALPQGYADRSQVTKMVSVFHRELLELDGSDAVVDYADNVERVGAYRSVNESGTSMTIPASAAEGLERGDIAIADQTPEHPSGIAIKVTSITKSGSTATVSGTTPQPEEVYEQLDVEQVMVVDPEYFVPAEGFVVDESGTSQGGSGSDYEIDAFPNDDKHTTVVGGSASLGASPLFGGTYELETIPLIAKECDLGEYGKITGNVSVTPGVIYDLHLGVFSKTRAEIGVTGRVDVDFKADVKAIPEKYRKIELGSVPVMGEKLTNTGAFLTFYLNLNLDGSFDVEARVEMRATVSTDNGAQTSSTVSKFKAEAQVSAKIGPSVEAELLLFDQRVAGAGIEAGAQGSASLVTHAEERLICSDFRAYLYADFTYDVLGALDLGFNSGRKAILDEKNSPLEVAVHMENGKVVPECTWGKDQDDEQGTDESEDPGHPDTKPDERPSLFDRMPTYFDYSSGVGGWGTDLYLNDDGTFDGMYFDMDADVTTISQFSGRFSEPVKIDEHSYSMRLEKLSYRWPQSGSRTEHGRRYEFTKAHGLDEGTSFTVYLPGTNVSELPSSGYLSTYNGSLDKNGNLTGYVIFNNTNGATFIGPLGASGGWTESIDALREMLGITF